FFLKPTCITYPSGFAVAGGSYFAPFVFAGCYPEHFVAAHPQSYFTTTFGIIAFTMCIYRFGKPNPILKTEGFVGKGSYRTHINYVTYKVVGQGFTDTGADTCMVATIKDSMLAAIGKLVSCEYTTEAHNTAIHM